MSLSGVTAAGISEMRLQIAAKNSKGPQDSLRNREFFLCVSGTHFDGKPRNDPVTFAFSQDCYQLQGGRPAYSMQRWFTAENTDPEET